jgi:MFS family permease
MLLVGRFFLGCSFIFTGAGGPSWLMEIAPPKRRGLITNGMLGSLPMTGTIGAIIFLYIWESDSEWAWRGGLMVSKAPCYLAKLVYDYCSHMGYQHTY